MIKRDAQILIEANKIASPHGLTASYLGNVQSVGVGGDHRTYTRIIVLRGVYPGDEALAKVSTTISNVTGINRVVFETTPGLMCRSTGRDEKIHL